MKKSLAVKKRGFLFRKRYLKLLSVKPQQSQLTQQLINIAPDPVIKLISNAAIHAALGKVPLSTKYKKLFRKKKRLFEILANKKIAIGEKRKLLTQKGGAVIIPALLSVIAQAIGNHIFSLVNG